MEKVVARENMWAALKQVEENKGAGGIDGIQVDNLRDHLRKVWPHAGLQLAIGHGCAPEAALKVKHAALRTLRPTGDVPVFEVEPAIGVHTEPVTLGMAF